MIRSSVRENQEQCYVYILHKDTKLNSLPHQSEKMCIFSNVQTQRNYTLNAPPVRALSYNQHTDSRKCFNIRITIICMTNQYLIKIIHIYTHLGSNVNCLEPL